MTAEETGDMVVGIFGMCVVVVLIFALIRQNLDRTSAEGKIEIRNYVFAQMMETEI